MFLWFVVSALSGLICSHLPKKVTQLDVGFWPLHACTHLHALFPSLMHINMKTHRHTCAHLHALSFTHVHKHENIHAHTCTRLHVLFPSFVHINMKTHMHTHTCMHPHSQAHSYTKGSPICTHPMVPEKCYLAWQRGLCRFN